MVIKLIRTVNDVRNPKWMNAAHTFLDCEVNFNELDEEYVLFTANPNDSEEHGRQIYADCVAGNYGEIEEFDVEAFEAQQEADRVSEEAAATAKTAAQNKLKAGTPLTDDDLEALGLS